MSLLLRAAPTSVLDNGLSKLWFRKLLKFQTRRLIFLGEASRQSSSLIRCDHSSVSYCGVLTFEVETFSELTEHRTAVAWVLVIGRVAAKPQAQLASAPEGSVILSLSLGGVGKLISAPRPKVTAAERQVQLAHPPVEVRAYKPPSQPTEMRADGCEIDFVVNLELVARPVVGHFVFQTHPIVPSAVDVGFAFHFEVVIGAGESDYAATADAEP